MALFLAGHTSAQEPQPVQSIRDQPSVNFLSFARDGSFACERCAKKRGNENERAAQRMEFLRANDARKNANRGTAAAGCAYSDHGRNIDAQGSLRLRILPKIRERGVTMARIKVSGTNLTKHFTFAEYGKNQTGTVKLTAEAARLAEAAE